MDVRDVLDLGHEVADLAGRQLVAGGHAGPELAELDDVVLGAAAHQLDLLPFASRPFHDADVDDDALVGVEVAVVDEGLERRVRARRAAAGCGR